ncbi:MAG: acyltransferase family protein [Acidimicrobiales bacterium]
MTTLPPRAPVAEPVATAWKRRDDIQGLRALAVLLVVAYHADGAIPGGFIGVDMFFVVSGFVITGMVGRQLDSRAGFSFGEFCSRRVRRILPALALMLSVVAVVSPFVLSPLGPQASTAETGRAASLFSANFELSQARGYFSRAAETNALLHTWSLSVEEQFYLAFAALLAVVAWSARARPGMWKHRVVLILGVAAGGSLWVSLVMTEGGLGGVFSNPEQLAFYSSFRGPGSSWPAPFWSWQLLASLRRCRRWLRGRSGWRGWPWSCLPQRPTTGGRCSQGRRRSSLSWGRASCWRQGRAAVGVSELLAVRPLQWVGDRSYSWYLWHWPAIVFARSMWPEATHAAVIAAVASLLPAAFVYTMFESRIRAMDLFAGRRAVGLAGLCITIPLALFAVSPLVSEWWRTADAEELVAADRLHADTVRGCDGDAPLADKPASCTWAVPDPVGTVVLLGDSNAGHLTEPLAAAANAHDRTFTVATKSGCPFIDLDMARSGTRDVACREFVTETLEDVRRLHPDVVVVSMSDSYLDAPDVELTEPSTGRRATTPADRHALWTVGLHSTLESLARSADRAIVVHTIPHLFLDPTTLWDPVACGARAIHHPTSCAIAVDRADIELARREAVDRR